MPSSKPCSFDGCNNRHRRGGYCHTHNMQQARTGQMWPIGTRRRRRGTCAFPDCGKVNHSHGYCDGHRWQLRRGLPLAPLRTTLPPKPKDLSAEPLRAYALEHGLDLPVRSNRRWVSLAEADEVCVRVFKVHPFFVYGDQWWDDKEVEAA